MATHVIFHEVDDVEHWLSSPKREEVFGVWRKNIGELADLTNIGTLFAFILVCIGVIVLRRTAPERKRPFRVPWVPWFPIVGVILCIALMCSLPVITWRRFFVWLALGLVIYFLYSVRHSNLRRGIDAGETENVLPPIEP